MFFRCDRSKAHVFVYLCREKKQKKLSEKWRKNRSTELLEQSIYTFTLYVIKRENRTTASRFPTSDFTMEQAAGTETKNEFEAERQSQSFTTRGYQMMSVFFQYLPSLCAAPPSVTVFTKMPSFSRPMSAPAPIPMMLMPRPSLSERRHDKERRWKVETQHNNTSFYFLPLFQKE